MRAVDGLGTLRYHAAVRNRGATYNKESKQ
jgi:hypothetical protein